MRTAVTTIRNSTASIIDEAKARACALGFPYFQREDTLEDMVARYGGDGFLIYGKQLPYYWNGGEEYRFHMGTAVLRTSQMEKGNQDRLCRLLPSDRFCSVLDCTFGQAGDSSTMSWYLGDRGHVTALEKSDILYEIGRAGIAGYVDKEERLTQAVRRISLLHQDFKTFLSQAEPKSFDVIYFDPMFHHPVKREVNDMEGFRRAASYDGLEEEVLRLAMNVARQKIIVKERPFSPLFRNGLFTEIHGKKGQTTAYGVILLK